MIRYNVMRIQLFIPLPVFIAITEKMENEERKTVSKTRQIWKASYTLYIKYTI
jgi:small neutral amino acid transporter SnatA (MarC family)